MTAPSHTGIHPTWTLVMHVCLSECMCVCVTHRAVVVGESPSKATAAVTVLLGEFTGTVVQ